MSRRKEVHKIPYETHPADRPRQCVFGGTSNAFDFLPLDRSGNRRFIPIQVCPELVRHLEEHQRDFRTEDTKAGMVQAFLDSYPGNTVCSKQLYKEALNHDFDEP